MKKTDKLAWPAIFQLSAELPEQICFACPPSSCLPSPSSPHCCLLSSYSQTHVAHFTLPKPLCEYGIYRPFIPVTLIPGKTRALVSLLRYWFHRVVHTERRQARRAAQRWDALRAGSGLSSSSLDGSRKDHVLTPTNSADLFLNDISRQAHCEWRSANPPRSGRRCELCVTLCPCLPLSCLCEQFRKPCLIRLSSCHLLSETL